MRISNGNMKKPDFGFAPDELAALRKLKTPEKIQAFLDDEVRYSRDKSQLTCRGPRRVLRDRLGHCAEGAFFAAAALRVNGHPPLILDLEAVRDDDHVLAVYQQHGHWGAIAKSNYAGLRFREPVYRTLRELALSYYEHYYNAAGEKTLRNFSRPVGLQRFDRLNWMTTEDDLWTICEYLCVIAHTPLLSPQLVGKRRKMDGRLSRRAIRGMMEIIDTHQHLWDLDLFGYEWTARHARFNRSFRWPDYVEATRGYDIVKTVHLECDVNEPFMLQETQHLLRLSEQPDNALSGVVAGCRPESPDFLAYLEQIVGHPNLKGLRRILHVVPDEVSFSPHFIPNLQALPQHSLSFDLCFFGRQLPLALRLARACPDTQFILDHCGNPDIAGGDISVWRAAITELARFPNLVCKVSGIVVNTKPAGWTIDDLRPAVEHVIESFGWERVMFGSDWPVCTQAASFKQWIDALLEITKGAGEENQKKLFQANAERVYRLS